jgi:hypothetical protein
MKRKINVSVELYEYLDITDRKKEEDGASPYGIQVIELRRMRWSGQRNAYTILVVIPEGKRLLVRSIHRWEDNIKMYLK